jgi:phosphoinositide-3-kinase regulatory subunit 4
MISLDPSSRLTFSAYLRQYRSTAFPSIFYTFLHPFISSLSVPSTEPAPPAPAAVRGGTTVQQQQQQQEQVQQTLLRTDADETIEQVWNEWEVVKRYLDESLPSNERGVGTMG